MGTNLSMPESKIPPAAAGLRPFGWDEHFDKEAEEFRAGGFQFGRVAVENREQYLLLTAGGERAAEVSGRFLFEAEAPADFPKVGDWVAITDYPAEEKAVIHAVLPRRTRLSRNAAGKRTEEQVLAANIDVDFPRPGTGFRLQPPPARTANGHGPGERRRSGRRP